MTQDEIKRTEQDWDALAEKQLASITRDMKATAEDALVRAAHKVMAELESQEKTMKVEGSLHVVCQCNECKEKNT